jgi:DNA-binding NarL/FixJ family response regulator
MRSPSHANCRLPWNEPVTSSGPPGRERPVRTLLIDDARLIHEGLRTVLGRAGRFAIVGVAATEADGLRMAHRLKPDLTIVEPFMGSRLDLDPVRALRQACGPAKIVALSRVDDLTMALSSIKAGAAAYMLKTSPPEDLLRSIGRALQGWTTLDPRVGSTPPVTGAARPDPGWSLTRREREVLAELAQGLDNRSIADRLFISEETVKTHVKSILRKLGARDRVHAVVMALGQQLRQQARTGAPARDQQAQSLVGS